MNQEVFVTAGFTDITPHRPAILGGYERRTTPFRSVADPLEANVLILEDANERSIIVTADLLYPGELLRSELLGTLNLSDEELFLCASHTHYAPMTAPSMSRLGSVDRSYVSYVAGRIATLIQSLLRIDQPRNSCICKYQEGLLDHSINRRLRSLRLTRSGLSRTIGIGPNAEGDRDETVRLIRFEGIGGAPIAIVWSYACHATDFYDLTRVSAAYPGKVRARLRDKYGNIPVLFFQGFSGDARPPFAGLSREARVIIARLLRGPQFRLPGKREWEGWSRGMADSVCALTDAASRPLVIRTLRPRRIGIPERDFLTDGSGNQALTWHIIECGDFRVAGINAEPVVGYRKLLERALPGKILFTVGCLDQTRCYLPTDNMLREGGYEVDGFRPLFGFQGKFREHLQDSIIGPLRTASEAERSLSELGSSAGTQA